MTTNPPELRPFQTRDHNGRVYDIIHGNVSTDGPTTCTLIPVHDEQFTSISREEES